MAVLPFILLKSEWLYSGAVHPVVLIFDGRSGFTSFHCSQFPGACIKYNNRPGGGDIEGLADEVSFNGLVRPVFYAAKVVYFCVPHFNKLFRRFSAFFAGLAVD